MTVSTYYQVVVEYMTSFLGATAAFCFAISAIPQAIKSFRDKHSEGITWATACLWFVGEITMLSYVLLRYNTSDWQLLLNYVVNSFTCGVVLYFKLFPRARSSAIIKFDPTKEDTVSNNVKQVIVVRKDLGMRKGKLGAQVAHASMKFLIDNNESKRVDELKIKLTPVEAMWLSSSFTKIVVSVDSEEKLRDLMFKANVKGVECHHVIDAGKTEFNGVPTLTCAAFGPGRAEDIDEITGKLPLI